MRVCAFYVRSVAALTCVVCVHVYGRAEVLRFLMFRLDFNGYYDNILHLNGGASASAQASLSGLSDF